MKSPGRHDESLALSALELLPYFDYELALEVTRLALKADGRSADPKRTRTAFESVLSLGAIEAVRDLLAMPRTIQEGVRAALEKPSRDLAIAAVGAFVDHAQSTMKSPLVGLLGLRGYRLLELSYAVIAEYGEGAESDRESDLAHYLFAARELGRIGDLAACRRVLERFLPADHRILALISAIQAWNGGDRNTATVLLRRILSPEPRDTIDGIAAHLLGADAASRQRRDTAIHLLRESVELFSNNDDSRGLSKSLMSLGRVLRDFAEHEEDPDERNRGLEESIEKFLGAIELSHELVSKLGVEARQTLGRAEVGISRSLRLLGRFIEAVDAANLAVQEFESSSEEWREALQNLVDVLRQTRQYSHLLKLAGVPTDGPVPGGAAGEMVAASLVLELAKFDPEAGQLGSNALIERTNVVARFLEAEATRTDRQAAAVELREALIATEARIRLIASQIETLRANPDEFSPSTIDRMVEERDLLLANLRLHDANRYERVLDGLGL